MKTETVTPPKSAPASSSAIIEDTPARIHRSLYGKSDDPEHADNRGSREFLDGYAEGLTQTRANAIEAIPDEWERRGCPHPLPEGFIEWKRGFNAGSMRAAWERASGSVQNSALRSGGLAP